MSSDRRRNHKDLILWQKAMRFAADVHRMTQLLPRSEIFGLTSQIRRSAASIPSNVAEGAARRTTPEFIHFLHIARGSIAELETLLLLARQIGYLQGNVVAQILTRLDEVGRLVNAVITGLRRRQQAASSLPPTP